MREYRIIKYEYVVYAEKPKLVKNFFIEELKKGWFKLYWSRIPLHCGFNGFGIEFYVDNLYPFDSIIKAKKYVKELVKIDKKR